MASVTARVRSSTPSLAKMRRVTRGETVLAPVVAT
jgi:hypothetical protein